MVAVILNWIEDHKFFFHCGGLYLRRFCRQCNVRPDTALHRQHATHITGTVDTIYPALLGILALAHMTVDNGCVGKM